MSSAGANEARIVFITHPVEGAEAFARGLVEAHLAACVNLLPAQSVYRWQGAVESASESLLVVKTSTAALDALERHVAGAHPYELPEFVVLPPERLGTDYRAWILAQSAGT
jgi:periplasmic divalent cation tolerance protein